MEEFKKLFRWEFLVTLLAFIGSCISWYYTNNETNQMQDIRLTQASTELKSYDKRISQLEQRQNQYDTQVAVVKVQLDTIQSYLMDIKDDIKKSK